MTHEILIAGFGGQGILFAGKVLAYAAMIENKEVSFLPSYGPEMRGGTCNCSIIISDEPVSSPLVINPRHLLAMNLPSLDKFEWKVKKDGSITIDTSMVSRKIENDDVKKIEISATKIADETGSNKLANMVLLGKFIKETQVVSFDTLEKAVEKVVPASKKQLLEANLKAIRAGADI